MITIKLNEEQPLPCSHCNDFHGYQYYDCFRMHYTSVHNEDGKYTHGEYTDGKCLNRAKNVYCPQCGEKLPFKLLREDGENVDEQ